MDSDKLSQPSPIGSLTKQITDTLKTTGSIQDVPCKTSETGAQTRRLPSNESEIHEPSGKRGVAAPLTVIHGGTVAGRDNALLENVKLLAGSSPVEIRRERNGDYGFESNLIGYRIEGNVPPAAMAEIREQIITANAPATRREVGSLLGAMSMAMPSHDGSDGEAWLELVWMAIEDMPADVITEASKQMIKREKWRPTPAEILEECYWLARKRRALLKLRVVG